MKLFKNIVHFLNEKCKTEELEKPLFYFIADDLYYVGSFKPTTEDITDGVYILRSNTLFLIGTTNDFKFMLYMFKGPKFYMNQAIGIELTVDMKDGLNEYLMCEVLP